MKAHLVGEGQLEARPLCAELEASSFTRRLELLHPVAQSEADPEHNLRFWILFHSTCSGKGPAVRL